ncbi:MAG: T9SS type A sorting domain-containing protein [Bacteroidales bacterium]|jgi:exonuclease III|nr:T9SS type A sorting domain-containing protein [Bacteroidales bacterium]
MKTLFSLAVFFFFSVSLLAQDTLRIMHYNLLYYGVVTGWCNNSNNDPDDKNVHLRAILNEVKPDIFTVNEIAASEAVQNELMQNTLNVGGVNHYRKAMLRNQAGSDIVNMLYYDSRKLRLKKQYTAQNYLRDIDVYELYYYSNDLPMGDTAFVVCVVAHLKAGSSGSDADKRKVMAENSMRWLAPRFASENVLFMGDFNLYSGSEPAFQTMTSYNNPEISFIDPIGQGGEWNNNSFYAGIHTQSTNSSNDADGCKAGGGMDDRFDFILISDEVRFGTKKVRYVQNSYKAFGQDGQHFNGSIGSGNNGVVSAQVAQALQQMSDHLPVILDVSVDKTLDVNEFSPQTFMAVIQPNPVANKLKLSYYVSGSARMQLRLMDIYGKVLNTFALQSQPGRNTFETDIQALRTGIYILQLVDDKGNKEVLRLIKSN